MHVSQIFLESTVSQMLAPLAMDHFDLSMNMMHAACIFHLNDKAAVHLQPECQATFSKLYGLSVTTSVNYMMVQPFPMLHHTASCLLAGGEGGCDQHLYTFSLVQRCWVSSVAVL